MSPSLPRSYARTVLIDTSVLVERDRAREQLEPLLGDEERAISVITVSELLHGVHRAVGSRRARRNAFVEYVLAELAPIPITEAVARVHAEIWARLARRGETICAHDLWVAATALSHGFGLATLDERDFSRVRGLRLVAPRRSGPGT